MARSGMTHKSNDFRQACDLLRQADHVVVFTGAGMSAESGIPTFRDVGGLWDRFPPEKFATWQGLMSSYLFRPGQLAEFVYEVLWPIASALPNAGHRALSQLEAYTNVSVITQNIDGLHQSAGSHTVFEIHGTLYETESLRHTRRTPIEREELEQLALRLRAAKRGLFRRTRLMFVLNRLFGLSLKGFHRPRLVLFGDELAEPDWTNAQEAARRCDLFLQVGCSGQVFPAANLPLIAQRNATPVITISPEGGPGDLELRGTAASVLPLLIAEAFE